MATTVNGTNTGVGERMLRVAGAKSIVWEAATGVSEKVGNVRKTGAHSSEMWSCPSFSVSCLEY